MGFYDAIRVGASGAASGTGATTHNGGSGVVIIRYKFQ